MKKVWKKPKLVVLYKGRPEEAVLGTCKRAPDLGNPQNVQNACIRLKKGVCESCNRIDAT